MNIKKTFLDVIHMMALARSSGVSVLVLSIVVVVLTMVEIAGARGEEGTYTHEWAVQISGGDEKANEIATEQGFEIVTKIFQDTYLFKHKRLAKRSLSPNQDNHKTLTAHPNVIWAEQQEVKRRVKRDFFEDSDGASREKRSPFYTSTYMNDPKWPQMWYMNRGGNRDMDVQKAWAEGVTGKGVVVTILDDGLEKDHPDIIKNYDPNASYDVNSQDSDPMPRYDLLNSNRHGTRCAGEVAADANNSICALGAAFEASIGGVRMLDGDVTDAVEARSLALNPQHIDIYSASWGPDDDGKTVDGPGQLASRAFVEGVTNGRNGKGSIFVWASGNGGRDQDNCNCDGYTNSIWTLSISSATEKGEVPWYSEACSSTLASTYSSGSFGEKQIVTTDLHHSCTVSHTGTSASAPLAAGICALALQVNNKLTWRDMQHIVVRTARPENLKAPDWQTNGVGRKVSHRFGYGLMDAYGMVLLARNWTTVPLQRKCEVSAPHVDKLIPEKSVVTLNLEVSSCPGVNYLEHVQAKVTMMADRRGDLEIYLTSPAGTRSTLLAMRPRDISHTGFHSWPFMTVHMWGENPVGTWKLEIHNNGHFFSAGEAEFKEWGLNLYGTETKPGEPSQMLVTPTTKESLVTQDVPQISPVDTPKGTTEEREPMPHTTSSESAAPPTPSPIPIKLEAIQGCQKADKLACLVCVPDMYLYEGKCISACPEGYYGWHPEHSITKPKTSKCLKCHYTCKECLGPQDYECKTCWGDSDLYNEAMEQSFCRPSSLLKAYERQQKWNTLLLLLLLFLFVLILVLGVLVVRASRAVSRAESSAYSSLSKSQRNGCPQYKNITDQDQLITKIPFHDTSSDEEI